MEHYKLTFKDKLYFFFNDDYMKRYCYLYNKVELWEYQYFKNIDIRPPYDFSGYVDSYVRHLLFEYRMWE